jgi:hypothetical protein
VLLPMKSAMWTVPPSVEGSVKSGALSPTFKLLDGAVGCCAKPADPYSNAAMRDLLFIRTTASWTTTLSQEDVALYSNRLARKPLIWFAVLSELIVLS